jgi:hypothetical protein
MVLVMPSTRCLSITSATDPFGAPQSRTEMLRTIAKTHIELDAVICVLLLMAMDVMGLVMRKG